MVDIPADALNLAKDKIARAEELSPSDPERQMLYTEAHTLAVLANSMMIGRMRA